MFDLENKINKNKKNMKKLLMMLNPVKNNKLTI